MGEDAAGYPLKPPAPRSSPPTCACGAFRRRLVSRRCPAAPSRPAVSPPAAGGRLQIDEGIWPPPNSTAVLRRPSECLLLASPTDLRPPARLPAPVMAAVRRCPRGCPCWPSSGLRNLGNMCNPELNKGRLQSNKVVKTSKAPAKVPPKELIFTCSVCWNKLEEPATTTCGHIFCKNCIKQAIQVQKKFPTCRKYLKMNNFHRIYLPNTAR